MNPEVFDFDFWMKAYQEDPDGYEELSKAYVHRCIDEMEIPEERKQKMKGLYWKCVNDPNIRKIKDPYVRAQRASTMMWDKFYEYVDILNQVRGS